MIMLKLHETCKHCGANLILEPSGRMSEDVQWWLVKRCHNCWQHRDASGGIEEVIRLHDHYDETYKGVNK